MSKGTDGHLLERLVDKIAEKLGLAVEELTPLAETVIREFVWANAMSAVLSFIVLVILSTLVWKVARTLNHEMSELQIIGRSVVIVVFGIGIVIFLFSTHNSLTNMVAPHYFLLHELLGS